MGVSDLRDAFNGVSRPAYTATLALLDYQRSHDTEWQILVFRGTAADGTPFEIKSGLLKPGTVVNQAAKETAQALLDRGKPPT